MSKNILYTWTFDDTKNRSAFWYIAAISIVIGFAVWGFLTKQYGMSFVVLLVAGVAFFVENNSADHVDVSLTDLGIQVENAFYDYSRIQSYTMIYSHGQAIFLRLSLTQRGIRNIDLRLDNTVATELKNILSNYLEENPKQDMSFLDRIIYLLKL